MTPFRRLKGERGRYWAKLWKKGGGYFVVEMLHSGVKTSHLVDNTADKISIDCDWPLSTGNNESVIFFYKIDWIERLQTCF